MAWSETTSPNRTLRSIAVFEGAKGLMALALGLGLLELLHHDLHKWVLDWVTRFGFHPTQPLAALLLQYADALNATPLDMLEGMLAVYLGLRMAEAYGLWHQRAWAEWLGALSGGMYVPFEVHHLWRTPDLTGLTLLLLNVLIVGFLAWRLWQRRQAH